MTLDLLINAIKTSNEEEIDRYLESLPIEELRKQHDGTTALHEAVYKGDDELIEILLDAGIEVDMFNSCTRTPLQELAFRLMSDNVMPNAYKDVIGLLIKRGANRQNLLELHTNSVDDAVILEKIKNIAGVTKEDELAMARKIEAIFSVDKPSQKELTDTAPKQSPSDLPTLKHVVDDGGYETREAKRLCNVQHTSVETESFVNRVQKNSSGIKMGRF